MTRGMERVLRTFAVTGATVALAATIVPAQSTAPVVKKAEDEYMNIQVLKGTPADQLIPAMQFISAALGTDCDTCHVRGDFSKDDKDEKKTAREMMKMMNQINTANFEGHRAVTCFTCHHGSEDVANVPTIPDVEPKEEPKEEKPANLPAATAVLDKYLQAVGGADALGKVNSRVQTGTLSGFGGRSFPVEVYSKAPGKRASYVQMGQGANITAFDGKTGWLGNPGRPPHEMSAAEADAARFDADLRLAADLKTMYKQLDTRPSDKINGKDVVMVVARNEGQPPVRLYFDPGTGLLVRTVRYLETPVGRNPTQIDYEDYRDADGVKIPYKWTVARPNGRFTIQVSDAKTNVPVDDTKFAMPAAPPAGAPPKGEPPKGEPPKGGPPKPKPPQ